MERYKCIILKHRLIEDGHPQPRSRLKQCYKRTAQNEQSGVKILAEKIKCVGEEEKEKTENST